MNKLTGSETFSKEDILDLLDFIEGLDTLSPDDWSNIAQYCSENEMPYKKDK